MIFSIIIFILILSVLVMIHEFGHFIMAKRGGIGVEEFGFGLPPRVWGKKVGETIYSVNWLPFGGFVRLVGEDPTDKNRDKKNSFYTKGLSRRITVVLAGVFMNFILAVLIFYVVLFALKFNVVIPKIIDHKFRFADQSSAVILATNNTNDGLIENIESLDDKPLSELSDFSKIAGDPNKTGDFKLVLKNTKTGAERHLMAGFSKKVLVQNVEESSIAKNADIRQGDFIVSVENQHIRNIEQLQSIIRNSDGKSLKFVVESGNQQRTLTVTPAFNEKQGNVAIGVALGEMDFMSSNGQASESVFLSDVFVLNYQTFPQKMFAGFGHSYNVMDYSLRVLGKIIGYSTEKKDLEPVKESVSGPVGIGKIFSEIIKQGPIAVLQFTGLISLNLALMNVLPIPALDGGRFFFLLIEAVTRKKVRPSVEKWTHTIGFALLIGLIVLITYNDILKIFH